MRVSDLRTPDEWCAAYGIQIMDPDGWRGSKGRPWTDPIDVVEFQRRLWICTINSATGAWDRLADDVKAVQS